MAYSEPAGEGSDKTTTVQPVTLASLPDDRQQLVLRTQRQLADLVESHVQLISKDPVDTPDLRLALGASVAGAMQGGEDESMDFKYTLIVFDAKVAGESSSRPRYRLPSLQQEEVKRLLNAARARVRSQDPKKDDGSLEPADMYLLLDGGRNVDATLMGFFHGKVKVVRQTHIITEQTTLVSRYSRIKAALGVHNQLEGMKVITQSIPKTRPRQHKHYLGNNTGNVIGPVVLEAWDKSWNLTFKDKKLLFGPRGIIPVGGKGNVSETVDAEPGEDDRPRDDSTVEPVFFHSLPINFWDDTIDAMGAKAVIDLTASDSSLALSCIQAGIPYVGCVFSRFHADKLRARLAEQVLTAATDQHNPLFDPSLVQALFDKAAPKGKAKANAKGKPKKKAKAKARPNKGDGDDPDAAGDGGDVDSLDPEEEDPEDDDPFE
jgi:hypothetical protein